MKVRKIDIAQKLIEVREGTPIYWEAEYDPSNIMIRTQGEIPDVTTVLQHAYEIRQIYKPGLFSQEKEYLAIRLDDRGLFDDIIQVSNDVLKGKLDKAREDGFWDGEQRGFQIGEKRMLKAIRAYPWYKRLFLNHFIKP